MCSHIFIWWTRISSRVISTYYICSLAYHHQVALKNDYVRPVMVEDDDNRVISIDDGRHPIVRFFEIC